MLLVMALEGLLVDPRRRGDAVALCVSSTGFAHQTIGFLHTVRMTRGLKHQGRRAMPPGFRAENRPIVRIFTGGGDGGIEL